MGARRLLKNMAGQLQKSMGGNNRLTRYLFFCFLVLLLFSPMAIGAVPEYDSPINSKAKEWEVSDWLNSKELYLKDLKGKVILVRWWTAPNCPFCHNSAPALNEFYEQYHNKSLEVIGFYHHKSLGPVRKKIVKKYSDSFGFKFPVAIDYEWKTLKDWWLNDNERKWTSVSFLIDKNGVIRYIHPGGQYVKGDKDYTELKAMIEQLLNEEGI